MGVTVLAASGDNGSSDFGSTPEIHRDFLPASSPFPAAVGRNLQFPAPRSAAMQAWNELRANEGGDGGGVAGGLARVSSR